MTSLWIFVPPVSMALRVTLAPLWCRFWNLVHQVCLCSVFGFLVACTPTDGTTGASQTGAGTVVNEGDFGAFAVVPTAPIPYYASYTDVGGETPLGEFAPNEQLCLKNEMLTWQNQQIAEINLPSAQGWVYTSLSIVNADLPPDPADNQQCVTKLQQDASLAQNTPAPPAQTSGESLTPEEIELGKKVVLGCAVDWVKYHKYGAPYVAKKCLEKASEEGAEFAVRSYVCGNPDIQERLNNDVVLETAVYSELNCN